jgi:hypothetical protein
MNTTDVRDDAVLATLSALRRRDVSRSRAERLRRHCHTALRVAKTPPFASGVISRGSAWRRMVGPAVAGAWCAIYVFETIRRAAAFYGL